MESLIDPRNLKYLVVDSRTGVVLYEGLDFFTVLKAMKFNENAILID